MTIDVKCILDYHGFKAQTDIPDLFTSKLMRQKLIVRLELKNGSGVIKKWVENKLNQPQGR